MFPDTPPGNPNAWIEVNRRLSAAQKFQIVETLSSTYFNVVERAIHQAYPDRSEDQHHVELVRVMYGDELAAKIEQHLNDRRNEA